MDVEELVRKVLEARERVASRVPDIDPGDLFHILEMVFRPFGSGLSFEIGLGLEMTIHLNYTLGLGMLRPLGLIKKWRGL